VMRQRYGTASYFVPTSFPKPWVFHFGLLPLITGAFIREEGARWILYHAKQHGLCRI